MKQRMRIVCASVVACGAIQHSRERAVADGGASKLYPRRWAMAAGAAIGADARRAALTVAQFNVLADGLAGMQTKSSFTECPTAALSWTYRSKRIIEELTRHGVMPDVIALEEVDHFHDDLLPALQRLGYAGAFEAKPDSPCKRSLDPTLEDGCVRPAVPSLA